CGSGARAGGNAPGCRKGSSGHRRDSNSGRLWEHWCGRRLQRAVWGGGSERLPQTVAADHLGERSQGHRPRHRGGHPRPLAQRKASR
ncbi:hypothetical protein KI387_018901, partial [Taxus chinensis]